MKTVVLANRRKNYIRTQAYSFRDRVLADGGTVDSLPNVRKAYTELDGLESLVISPLAYKESKVYALKPSDSPYADGTFTRVGTADRINQLGEVETMAENVVRVDYSDMFPTALGSELITNGTFDDDSDWILQNDTTVNNKLIVNSSSEYSPLATQYVSFSVNTTFLLEFEVTDYVSGTINVRQGSSGANNIIAITSNGEYSIEFDGLEESQFSFRSGGGNTIANIDNVSVKQIYGNDTEDGEPVILLEDNESLISFGSVNDVNSEEGVIYADIQGLTNGGVLRSLGLYKQQDTRITLILHSTTNRIQFFIAMGGYENIVNLDATDIDQTEQNKIACRFEANNYALFINGVKKAENITQSNTIEANSLDSFDFGMPQNGYNDNPFKGKIKEVKVYKKALTDTQLTELTTYGKVITL